MDNQEKGYTTGKLVEWWVKTSINLALVLVLLDYWSDTGFSFGGLFFAVVIMMLMLSFNPLEAPPWGKGE